MLQKWALSLLKPALAKWLTTRALALPAAQQQALAERICQATDGRVSAVDATTALQLAQAELQAAAVAGIEHLW
ncbi:MAG TPA: hypothetical protein VKT32_01410 [Chthonomonadaceae bacterium]|nr:hypothetical protein [Chthonomonadaceae bacterium]